MTAPLAADLGDARFVALTTFRRDGTPVVTPVWIARDGADLVVWTERGTGKVKRIRRDPSVELRQCGRRGQTIPGAPVVRGRARIDTDHATLERVQGLLRRKYGLEFRVVTLLERILSRGKATRCVLVIAPDDSAITCWPT